MNDKRAYKIENPSLVDLDHATDLEGPFTWTMGETGTSPIYVWTQKDGNKGEVYDRRTLLIENLASNYLSALQK